MKKTKTRITAILALIALLGLTVGCFWVEEEEDDDYCYDCPPPPCYDCGPVEEWFMLGPVNTLSVGNACCGGPCFDCAWFDEDYSWDTLVLTGDDWELVDMMFNYTVANWGNYTTSVWVSLCDYYGCEDVIYQDLYPGEMVYGAVYNPVLDTALYDFFDCLDLYGAACYMEYDIDVYLGEECSCSPVTIDYYYEGLYVY